MNQHTEKQPDRERWEIDLLGDVDPTVRLRSAMELGTRQAGEAASALVERLGLERDFFVRETLTWAVLRIADDALPYLLPTLSSARWLARMQAVHVLGKMGRQEDADRLAPLVRDGVDAVASRAYWAAGRTHNPSVVPALVGQLSRGDSEHRNSLTVALAGLGEVVVPALVDALRSGPGADVPPACCGHPQPHGFPERRPGSPAVGRGVGRRGRAGPPRRAQRDRPAAGAFR
jgi:hypothetical protein